MSGRKPAYENKEGGTPYDKSNVSEIIHIKGRVVCVCAEDEMLEVLHDVNCKFMSIW